MNTAGITVLVVDDQDIVREALAALLSLEEGITVIGQARNGLEAVAEAKRLRPDVVLMDVRMPGLSGPEATQQIVATLGLRDVHILVLTTFEDIDVVRACLQAGAEGFIGKTSSRAILVDAIHSVTRGETPLSSRAARAVLDSFVGRVAEKPQPPANALTARELEIVRLVGQGCGNEEIARRLSISVATAKTHIRNAMKKLTVRNRAQLVVAARRFDFTIGA